MITATVKELGLPSMLVGVGSQVVFTRSGEPEASSFDLLPQDKEMLQAVSITARGQPNVFVKGKFTETLVNGIGQPHTVATLGCPSLLLNPLPTLGEIL